ncbi:MAG TPA: hypothetical protein VLF68_04990 [Candidatus Saccharimonadales bacterium]|nr:hypothetical protein [Candidatus Saccharimonadales bacterium]
MAYGQKEGLEILPKGFFQEGVLGDIFPQSAFDVSHERQRPTLTMPTNPEMATVVWGSVLEGWAKASSLDREGIIFTVADCDWTEEETKEPMSDVNGEPLSGMLVYVPEQFKGKEGLLLASRMFPETRASWSVDGKMLVDDDTDRTGWIQVEQSLEAPNRNTTEEDLRNHAESYGFDGQREITYMLASRMSMELTGHFLDENTSSRLLGTHVKGRPAIAGYVARGDFYVYPNILPQNPTPLQDVKSPDVGGRFERTREVTTAYTSRVLFHI